MPEAGARPAPPAVSLDPRTRIGAVALTVNRLEQARNYYERALGLQAVDGADGAVALTSRAGDTLVELHGDRSAEPLDPGSPGLFHMAVLMPDRRALAKALAKIAALGLRLSGASDHLVSEALYLSDPEGNGIEIYRDRPVDEWTYDGGQLAMGTYPLNVEDLLAEVHEPVESEHQAPAGTRIGHVHLQVSDLAAAEEFYSGVLGFDVTVRGYPGALFVSAGGYHHHIGLNVWNTRPGAARRPGTVGLDHFEIVLPDQAELERVVARVRAAEAETEHQPGGWMTADPDGNRILLRTI